jgi:hypothetical protein
MQSRSVPFWNIRRQRLTAGNGTDREAMTVGHTDFVNVRDNAQPRRGKVKE